MKLKKLAKLAGAAALVGGATFLPGIGTAIAAGLWEGAVTGAIIGAGASLAMGGNIIEGTLKGALLGGIAGGAFRGTEQYLKTGFAAPLNGAGKTATGGAAITTEPAAASEGRSFLKGMQFEEGKNLAPTKGLLSRTDASIETLMAKSIESQAQATKDAALISGIAGGVSGFGTTAAASMMSDSSAKAATKAQENLREQNRPGGLALYIPDITLPPDWITATTEPLTTSISKPLTKYRPKPGLLQAGGAA